MPKRPPNIAILARNGSSSPIAATRAGPRCASRDLPPYLPKAFVAIEDRRFYSHLGIDPLGIGRALLRNVAAAAACRAARP